MNDDLASVPVRHRDLELSFEWQEQAGRVECVGLCIRTFRREDEGRQPLPGAEQIRPMPPAKIARLPLRELMDKARRDTREWTIALAAGTLPGATPEREEWARRQLPVWQRDFEARRPKSPPASRRQPVDYERVAEIWVMAKVEGVHPTKAVQEVYGLEKHGTAASWVSRARKRHPELFSEAAHQAAREMLAAERKSLEQAATKRRVRKARSAEKETT